MRIPLVRLNPRHSRPATANPQQSSTPAAPLSPTPASADLSGFSPTVTTGRGRVRFRDHPHPWRETGATIRTPAPAL